MEISFFQFAFKVVITLTAIMNPFYVIPSFLSITAEYDDNERKEIAKKSVLYAFLILFVFLLTGELIFYIFGITIGSFKIAGGTLLFLIGLNMIFEKPSDKDEKKQVLIKDAESRDNIALVPLAIPILAGPGTITTVLILKSNAPIWYYQSAILIAIIIACLIVYFVYLSSKYLNKLLGRMGINAISRIMGLILMAVSVEILINGIKILFPKFN